jgi:hypothetical protein
VRAVADWLRAIFDGRSRPWYRAEFIHPRDFAAALGAATPPRAAVRA